MLHYLRVTCIVLEVTLTSLEVNIAPTIVLFAIYLSWHSGQPVKACLGQYQESVLVWLLLGTADV